jgi:choline trimethylamine-lyase
MATSIPALMPGLDVSSPQPATARIAKLREAYFEYRPTVCLERALSYTRSYRGTEGLATSVRRAQALMRTCEEKSVTILDDELIVGMPAAAPRGGIFCPEIAWQWLERELDTISTREQDPYLITEEQKRLFREEIAPYWRGRSMEEYFLANLPDDTRRIAVETGVIDVEIKSQSGPGEFSPGYGNILLKRGFRGVAEAAGDTLAELDTANPDDYDKIHFLRSIVIACNAARILARRYAEEADHLALSADDSRATELRQVADICRHVPWNAPRTFHEALQCVWFGQVLLLLEENGPSYSPGRLDQYLIDFYKNDVAEGRLTEQAAQELLECFWIKTAGMTWLLNENCSKYFAGYMPFQNVNVGGRTQAGEDATNDLSYMMVRASMDLQLFQPSLSAFIHQGTPDQFLRHICHLVKLGGGFPALHGEETTIAMMKRKGVADEDLMDYCMVGCVEPNIHGKMSQWSDGGHYNFGAAVQFALGEGRSWIDGRQLGVATPDPNSFTSFAELKEAVKEQLRYFIHQIAVANLIVQAGHSIYLPKAVASSLVEGCVESGVDIANGGARYNSGPAFIGTGIADLADSLAAVEKLVFDDHRLSMSKLVDALKADFTDFEDVLQLLVNKAPKYGNDLDQVDELAREFTDYVADLVESYRGFTGCAIINGLYPVSSHVPHGKVVGALPSGRRAWSPLADGCSPFHGHDTLGPTAVIKSVAKIDRGTRQARC